MARSRTHSAFCIWMYKSGFPLILMIKYCRYILGIAFNMSSASSLYINKIMSFSVYVYIYTHLMPIVAMSRPSCVPTPAVMNTNYVATLGEAMSYLLILSHWFLPSAHARTFISPLCFSFRNIVMSPPSIVVVLLVWLYPMGKMLLGHVGVSVPLWLLLRFLP